MPAVETNRLLLRMPTLADLDNLHALFGHPDVMKYVGTGVPLSKDETATALLSMIRHWERHGFGRWVVVEKERQEFVGFGGLRMLIDTPEVVYHLAKKFWGVGLATEVARASLRFGFEEQHSERIVAIAKAGNNASLHVMEKVGMRYEKHATYYNFDVIQYCISAGEYHPDASPYVLHSDE